MQGPPFSISSTFVIFIFIITAILALPRWLNGKESACQCRKAEFSPWVGKNPWRGKQQPTPVFLPGELLEQRSLAGYCPWCCKRVRHDSVTKQQHHSHPNMWEVINSLWFWFAFPFFFFFLHFLMISDVEHLLYTCLYIFFGKMSI